MRTPLYGAARRSTVRLTAEVLEHASAAGGEGVANSDVIRRVRLAGARANSIIGDLVSAGLVIQSGTPRGMNLTITPRGVEMLDNCREFIDLVESYGLEI